MEAASIWTPLSLGPHELTLVVREEGRPEAKATVRVVVDHGEPPVPPRWPDLQPAPADALLHHATGRDPGRVRLELTLGLKVATAKFACHRVSSRTRMVEPD
jgi:hypothetical protein